MSTYDNPLRMTYTLAASAIDAASTKLMIVGPTGKKGRVSAMTAVIFAATDIATLVRLGDSATGAQYGTLSVPIGAAGVGANAPTLPDIEIAANAVIHLNSNGGTVAGDADLAVTIDWY